VQPPAGGGDNSFYQGDLPNRLTLSGRQKGHHSLEKKSGGDLLNSGGSELLSWGVNASCAPLVNWNLLNDPPTDGHPKRQKVLRENSGLGWGTWRVVEIKG